jgi:deoxycytidylate deaminase
VSKGTARQNVQALAYDKRGKLLAVGRNSYTKTHRLQYHYALKAKRPGRIFLHAELDALIRASRRGKVHKLVVIRIGRNGKEMLAKPCECCQLAIIDFNVKVVEHT